MNRRLLIYLVFLPLLLRAQPGSADRLQSLLLLDKQEVISARAAGMGNAFSAAVQGAAAIRINPAALARCGDLAFWFSGQMSSTTLSPASYNGDSFLNWDIDHQSQLQLNYVAAVFRWSPLKENVHIGLGIGQQKNYPETERHSVAAGNTIEYSWQNTLNNGVEFVFSAAASVDLSDRLFLGVSFNFWSAESEIIAFNRRSSIATEDNYALSQERTMSDYTTITLGTLYHVSADLDIGLNIRFPYHISLRPVIPESRPLPGETGFDFVETMVVKFPLSFNGGLSYHVLPDLIFAFDFVYKPWSQISIEDPYNIRPPGYNVHSFHLGLEYIYPVNDVNIPLRAGYYSTPTMIEQEDNRQLMLNTFTIGSGCHYKRLAFDIAVEWVPVSYTVNNYDFDPHYQMDRVSFDGDFIRIIFDLSAAVDYK